MISTAMSLFPANGIMLLIFLKGLLRFRMKTINADILTCLVEYTCRGRIGEREALMRVRYAVRSHRWSLFQGES